MDIERIISKPEIETITGVSAKTISRLEAEGDFPARRQISPGRVGWLLSEVTDWLRGREKA